MPNEHYESRSSDSPYQPVSYQGAEPVYPPVHGGEGHTHATRSEDQPLPVCDYTTDGEEPCEEPVVAKRWSSATVIIAATSGALAGGLLVATVAAFAFGVFPGVRPLLAGSTSEPQTTLQQLTIKPNGQETVASAVARKVTNSVVNIKFEQRVIDPLTGAEGTQEAGNGSGVIIREDGHILTNYHVIQDAARVVVTVGVEDKVAKVVGVDPSTDLAVLKIDGGPYPEIDVGSSKELQVGDFVLAVGSPFGLEKTVTSGIVSALQRTSDGGTPNEITRYTNLIQTDAAINPGNSGGALVDDQGRLVGINTLIQSPAGQIGAPQSAGIGFAIPVDFAKQIADQLIATGRATHPYLGVSTQTIDETAAQQFGLPVQRGALVRFVQPNSPAEKSGFKVDDIIVRVGEFDIGSVDEVFGALREYKVGDQVPIEVVRGDTRRTLEVTLGSDADRQP
ncbi:MAG: trypsin-like peptidase domain-containing protein [Coriobacteriales bacterium]|nr:trypsin-like peptidase domain-containing protein [Coriobacteriales bacterium]